MRRRGFLLVVTLLLLAVLLVLGLGFLASRSRQYQSSADFLQSAQARALAEAGMEDARAKLDKDLLFPPPSAEDQQLFTYAEDLPAIGGASVVGSYVVTVDTRMRDTEPYRVIRVTSVGYLGARTDPRAVRRLYCEIDVAPLNRITGVGVNPNLFQVINWRDEGSL